MYVIVPFTNNGSPATGLTPTVSIVDVDTTVPVVTNAPMIEIGNGFYKYLFSTYQPNRNYAITIDGGVSLPLGERWAFTGNNSIYEDVGSLLNENVGGYIA